MKKLFAILMILVVFTASFAIPSSAAVTPGETKFSAKKGDVIEYSLNLTVPEKLVGCDFSIYYDSSKLKITDYADFNGYDESNQVATMNTLIQNEFVLVWTNLSGIACNNKSIAKIKFEALSDITDTHITYFVRYLYPESMEQYTDYKFSCDLKVNDAEIISKKAPELNLGGEKGQGLFINSLDGDGKNAGDFKIVMATEAPSTEDNTESETSVEVPIDDDEINDEKQESSDKTDKDKDDSVVTTKDYDAVKNGIIITICVVGGILLLSLSIGMIFVFKKK